MPNKTPLKTRKTKTANRPGKPKLLLDDPKSAEAVKFYFKLKNISREVQLKKESGLYNTLYLCPAGSIIEKFVKLFWNRTDIPLNIVYNSFLVALGGYLVQQDKKIMFSAQKIYTNLWILSLGKSAIGKTTIFDFISNYFGDKIAIDEPNYQTKAAMVDDFNNFPETKRNVIIIDEIAQNIKLFRQAGSQQTLKEAYLNIYGGKISHTTKKDGKIQISDIFISIAAGTVISTFQECTTSEDNNDGYLPRFMFSLANDFERNMKNWPYIWKKTEIEAVQKTFREYTTRVQGIVEFHVNQKAISLLKKYYFEHFDSNLEAHYKRYLWATLKIAGIYNTLLECDGIISNIDMEWALRVIEQNLDSLYQVMDKYLSFNEFEKIIQKVRIFKDENTESSPRDVMRKLHLTKQTYETVINELKARDYLP